MRHPKTKLTPEQLRAIRENRRGKPYRLLACEFGVHVNTVKRAAWQLTHRGVA